MGIVYSSLIIILILLGKSIERRYASVSSTLYFLIYLQPSMILEMSRLLSFNEIDNIKYFESDYTI